MRVVMEGSLESRKIVFRPNKKKNRVIRKIKISLKKRTKNESI